MNRTIFNNARDVIEAYASGLINRDEARAILGVAKPDDGAGAGEA